MEQEVGIAASPPFFPNEGASLDRQALQTCTLSNLSWSLQPYQQDCMVARTVRRLRWRVYVTNHPTAGLSLEQAALAYREEDLVEHGFGRLKGKPLSPKDVQSEQRATGLVRLLSLGLRVLTLLEFRVRQRLADQQDNLAGVYAGNPKRTTYRPTKEGGSNSLETVTNCRQ